MNIKIENQETGQVNVILNGRWLSKSDNRNFYKIVEYIDDPEINIIIIDITDLIEILSPGLGCLLDIRDKIGDNKELIITSPEKEQVITMFRVSRFYEVFGIKEKGS